MRVLHLIEWPAAILVGFGLGWLARKRGYRLWLVYAAMLLAGIAILAGSYAFGIEKDEKPWHGLLIWAAWAGFGAWQGWRRESAPKPTGTWLDLGRREGQ